MLSPLYVAQGYQFEREWNILTHHWGIIAYVVLFTSILSYYMWHKGIATIGADKTGQFTHLMPIFGSFLAYIFLGEALEWYHLGGGMLIGIGIYLSLFRGRVSRSKEECKFFVSTFLRFIRYHTKY